MGFHRLLKVTVLGIQGANVKLGFEVDPDVPVHRSEVWERITGSDWSDRLTVTLNQCFETRVRPLF